MLACGVGRHREATLEGQHRSNIDDLAAARPQHRAAGCLTQEEYRAKIDIHYVVPIDLGKVLGRPATDGPGIVDQDVDGTVGILGLGHDVRNSLRGRQVRLNNMEAAAQAAHLLSGFVLRGAIHADDVGARSRQTQCDGPAQPFAGAGNDRMLATQVERGIHVAFLT